MKFIINNKQQDNLLTLMRRLGYSPSRHGDSFIRRAGRLNFPRFHIYLKELEQGWQVNLHLDQKGACYDKQTAHSGDYDGGVVADEAERIQSFLNN